MTNKLVLKSPRVTVGVTSLMRCSRSSSGGRR